MLHMIIGGAGCGKSTMLIGKIRETAAAGGDVRTFVPEQFAFTGSCMTPWVRRNSTGSARAASVR